MSVENVRTMNIKKTGEDRYHATVDSEGIDEEVNSVQLRGMFTTITLVDTTFGDIESRFDREKVGFEQPARYYKRFIPQE